MLGDGPSDRHGSRGIASRSRSDPVSLATQTRPPSLLYPTLGEPRRPGYRSPSPVISERRRWLLPATPTAESVFVFPIERFRLALPGTPLQKPLPDFSAFRARPTGRRGNAILVCPDDAGAAAFASQPTLIVRPMSIGSTRRLRCALPIATSRDGLGGALSMTFGMLGSEAPQTTWTALAPWDDSSFNRDRTVSSCPIPPRALHPACR
jgi:hypothetical protein